MTDLSSRLASGDTLYGTFLGLGSALAAEACALAGFDWLLTDLEHGGGGEDLDQWGYDPFAALTRLVEHCLDQVHHPQPPSPSS